MTEHSIEPFGQTDEMPAGINVVNRLDSTSSRQALAANQGRVLKALIDEKADDNDIVPTRFSVNLCKSVEAGVLNESGEVVSGSGLVTDFIPIAMIKKTQYLHVCCSEFFLTAFDYAATKVCIYGASKMLIGTISSVSDVIDKESQANELYFATAQFIRVQFAADTTDHYVALSNKPVLPEYAPYDKAALIPTSEVVFPKIHNTDGAITNMLETALDYINNMDREVGGVQVGLNLGYGDTNTAYDLEVREVTPDPWTLNYYQDKKKQINCSCFVQLCLEGVRFGNSRYALGEDADNIGINGYVFDDKVETNYHNARVGDASWGQYSFTRFIPCSTHNKMYANVMLRYAMERGFAYIIKDDLSNVEVGDVIFKSKANNTTFKQVVHVLFVSGVSKKNDGSKVISVMEVTTLGSYGVARETDNINERQVSTSGIASAWFYAARFPLPKIASKAKNIVSEVTPQALSSSLSNGSSATIGTIKLSENIKAKGVYSVVVKCSAVGDFEVMVYAGSTALGTNGESLLRRGDGVTVKHFNLPVDSSINTDTLTVKIKAYDTVAANSVGLVDAKVFNGYVTE